MDVNYGGHTQWDVKINNKINKGVMMLNSFANIGL
jgi:hypothetical protein